MGEKKLYHTILGIKLHNPIEGFNEYMRFYRMRIPKGELYGKLLDAGHLKLRPLEKEARNILKVVKRNSLSIFIIGYGMLWISALKFLQILI